MQPVDTRNPLEALTLERLYSYVVQNHVQKFGSLQFLFSEMLFWLRAVTKGRGPGISHSYY